MKRINKHRLGTYLPNLETLESRMQPGSLLSSGLDLAVLGSTLDQSQGSNNTGTSLNQNLNLSFGSFKNNQANNGGVVSVAPYQVTRTTTEATSSLTMGTSQSSDLGSQNQALGSASQHLHQGAAQRSTAVSTGGQSVGQNNQGSPLTLGSVAPTLQAAPAFTQLPAATAAPLGLTPQRFDVNLTQVASHGQHTPVTATGASFLSFPTTASLNAIKVSTSNGLLYSVGTITDAGTGHKDAIVIATDPNVQVIYYETFLAVGNSDTTGQGIAFDSQGNVLVSGSQNATGMVVSLDPTLSVTNWTFTLNSAGLPSFPGVADGFDPTTGANGVFVTGLDTNTGTNTNILIVETDESGNLVFGYQYEFGNNTVKSIGNNLAIDPTGNIDLVGQLAGTGVLDPAVFQTPAGGMLLTGGYFGAGGNMNGIALDNNGDIFASGGILNGSGQDMGVLVASFDPTLSQLYGGVASFSSGISGVGTGSAVDTPAGDQYVSVTVSATGTTQTLVDILVIDPTGTMVIDQGDGGVNGTGVSTTAPNGLAIDPDNPTNNPADLYVVGVTQDPGYGPVNGFGSVYGGGASDGILEHLTSP
jgi:hypothetical protein